MAQRRMFTKAITNSSEFLMMPPTAQLLYVHFGMNADDDGFCEVFSIMRMTDSKPDDLRVLQARNFVKVFDDKVLVITDWKENNYIQKDRYTPSKYLKVYKKELKLLKNNMDTHGRDIECTQDVYKVDTQVRLGKVRLGKERVYTGKQVAGVDDFNKVEKLTDYFISLKGLKNVREARYFKAAKDLLVLADDDLLVAKEKLDKLKVWAEGNGLEYEMETAIKKYVEL